VVTHATPVAPKAVNPTGTERAAPLPLGATRAPLSHREERWRAEEQPHWRLEHGEEFAPGRHALKRLGGGHRYDAYLTWDDRLHAVVVAKLVRPHLVDDHPTLEGLSREAKMLSRLNHPVVVRMFDAVLDGPLPHLVLEHLEGPRLSTLVRKYGPLPLEQLVPLAVQLSSALHYLSEEGIVHLDVTPSNIIMGAPPRLIDLSVARDAAAAASLTEPIGTDAYMAPEQADPVHLGPVRAPADVWGLGVTLYKAATGNRPFSDPDPEGEGDDRWPQLTEDPRELAGAVSDALAGPMMACLAHDPAARPPPAQLAGAMERLLEALPRPRLSRLKPRVG
jgi:eukaryotic-like serine/threonine-protein kinase